MALAISTNFAISATRANNAMKSAQSLMGKSIGRISTGNRAANPGDDPLSYFSGNKIKGDTDGYTALYNNIQDAGARLNVQDTSLSTMADILTEMKSKAAAYKVATDAGNTEAAASIQKAFTGLESALASAQTAYYKGNNNAYGSVTVATSIYSGDNAGAQAAQGAQAASVTIDNAVNVTGTVSSNRESVFTHTVATTSDLTKIKVDNTSVALSNSNINGSFTYKGEDFTIVNGAIKYNDTALNAGSVVTTDGSKLSFTLSENDFASGQPLYGKLGWSSGDRDVEFDSGAVTSNEDTAYKNTVTISSPSSVSSGSFDDTNDEATANTLKGTVSYSDGTNSVNFTIENGKLKDSNGTAKGDITLNAGALSFTIPAGTYGSGGGGAGNMSVGVSAPDVSSAAIDDIEGIQTALDNVSNARVEVGGHLSALDYVSSYISQMKTANEAAYTAVTETDMASEMTSYVKNNVYSQAAQAMVSQANQSLAQVLNLLQ